MSGFGGFAPLPLRLGGSATEGWTAAQHARACADLVAIAKTAKFATITCTIAAGVVTLHSYRGANGVGAAHAPTLASGSTGVLTVTFAATYETEAGDVWASSVRDADAAAHGSAPLAAYVDSITPTGFTVRIRNTTNETLTDGKVTIHVYADRAVLGRAPRIGDYGGALDKRDSTTEATPYAWAWYQEFESMIGSAFTRSRQSLVHVRKLTLARNAAAVTRNSEKIGANQIAGTSDSALSDWVELLRVQLRGSESRQEVRTLAADLFALLKGNDKASVDESIAELLGSQLVAINRTYGTLLSDPPEYTYWPDVNDGPAGIDLGGGPWMSPRCHLTVQVVRPADIESAEFDYMMNVRLQRLLDDLLPAWATFSWTTTDGFILGESLLGYDGF